MGTTLIRFLVKLAFEVPLISNCQLSGGVKSIVTVRAPAHLKLSFKAVCTQLEDHDNGVFVLNILKKLILGGTCKY